VRLRPNLLLLIALLTVPAFGAEPALPSLLETLVSDGELSKGDAETLHRLKGRLIAKKIRSSPASLRLIYQDLQDAEGIQARRSLEIGSDYDPYFLVSKLDEPSKIQLLEGYWAFLRDSGKDPAKAALFKKVMVEPYDLYSRLQLSMKDRIALFQEMLEYAEKSNKASLASPAAVLESIFKEVAGHPGKYVEAEQFLKAPGLVAKMHFEKPAIELANWQLERAYPIQAWEKESRLHPNPSSSVRQRMASLKDSIYQRFAGLLNSSNDPFHYASSARNRFMDQLEERIQTSIAEHETLFKPYRHHFGKKQNTNNGIYASYRDQEYFPETYSPTSTLRIEDSNPFPRRVSMYDKRDISDVFGKRATLEYLTGVKSEMPKVKAEVEDVRGYIKHEIKAARRAEFAESRKKLAIWKRELEEATRDVKVSSLTELLGISGPKRQELKEILLGDKINDPVYSAFFDAHFESIKEERRNFEFAKIFASYRGDGSGVSLKTVFEAKGPGSVKFGQTLYSTKLAPEKELAELAKLLDRSQKPPRIEYMTRLWELFDGHQLSGKRVLPMDFFESVGVPVGSGSVNYGIDVRLQHPESGKQVRAVARFQREGIAKVIEEELEIYDKMFEKLLAHPDAEVRRAASKAFEAWTGASKTLRGADAIELNLDAERAAYPRAKEVYKRTGLRTRSGFRIEPVSPLVDFEKFLPEQLRKVIALYEFIPQTAWDEIRDEKLREKLAHDVIDLETKAILNGHFDKDGHTGNWLVDLKNRRIVRVDYAQLRTVKPEELSDFVEAFKVHARPMRQTGDAARVHALLPRIYRAEGIEAISEAEVQKWMTSDTYLMGKPNDRFFFLRDQIEDVLKKPVMLQEASNDLLANLLKSVFLEVVSELKAATAGCKANLLCQTRSSVLDGPLGPPPGLERVCLRSLSFRSASLAFNSETTS
jgi:hypothetical protein